jgi:glycosyltransferase involved in cell wall biosynthesis
LESLSGSDALSLRALTGPLIASDQMRARLINDGTKALDGVVLHSLGNFMGGSTRPRDGGFTGSTTGAAIFFEDTRLPDARELAKDYAVILAGSTWCEEIMRANGVDNVATVIQGIDPSLFHPAPKADNLAGRFAVFSGGKLEHRKAQDLVVLAFRAFAARHPEAILVTAWNSPWPITALSVNGNPKIVPIAMREDGKSDIAGWVAANGIAADQFIDIGTVPNHQMARILREMDVALFPNRCEGGTNLVAMECMACGVPTILSDNTGHQDLVRTGGTYVLSRQAAVIDAEKGTEGWGESDVDEMVEALESVWRDRAEAARRGEVAAAAMAKWSWHHQIGRLHDTLGRFSR